MTTLRPSPSGTERSIISSATGVVGAVPARGDGEQEHRDPDRRGRGQPHRPSGQGRPALEAVGQAAQHEDEQHGGQRLDRHLGQRQVGAALHDEQAGHRVAGGPEQQRRREPPVDGAGGHRRDQERHAHRHVARRSGERRPPRPPVAEHQRASRQQGGGGQDDAGVDRERTALRHRGDPVGQHVEPPQHRQVDLAAARHPPADRQHPVHRTAGCEQPARRPRARRPTAAAGARGRATRPGAPARPLATATRPAPLINPSTRAGATPNSSVSAASTAAGATNDTRGARRRARRRIPGRVAEGPPAEPQAVRHRQHRGEDHRHQDEARVGERARLEAGEGVLLGHEPEQQREPGHRRRRHQHDHRRPAANRGPGRGRRRMSRVPVWWSMMPTTMNSAALNRAWASTSSHASTTVSAVPRPNITTMNPSWLMVP